MSVTVPDFNFAAFYYPEILASLRAWARVNLPDVTSDNDYEVAVQLLKAFALVGHLNNVNLDAAANESIFGTARLLESVRQHLKLIGVEPAGATPSTAELLAKISRVFTGDVDIVPPYAQFSTEPIEGGPGRVFEYVSTAAITMSRNDRISAALSEDDTVFTDDTADAQAGNDWTPWATPSENDAVYFGHDSLLFNALHLIVTTAGSDYLGIWEYYNGDYADEKPDGVVLPGSTIKLWLDTLFNSQPAVGAEVRVQYDRTGAYEDLAVQWDGIELRNYVETTSLLGQVDPSGSIDDYTVGTLWNILEIDDDTAGFLDDGENLISFNLPQTPDRIMPRTWAKTTVNGIEAYWVRFRVVGVGGSETSPVLNLFDLAEAETFVQMRVTQGQRVSEEPLGYSSGEASQTFTLGRTGYIDGTIEITVDGTAWVEVENFLNSSSLDRHFTLERGEADAIIITFGDGTNGRIPPFTPSPAVINAYYRVDAALDGNVGVRTITVNRSGTAYLSDIFNPFEATGWAAAEGSTDEDLAKLKIEGPAEFRSLGRATTLLDVPTVAKSYTDAAGASPVARAFAIEEEFGPRTVGIHVVGNGGAQLSAAQLEDIAAYFNGDEDLGYEARILMNHLATLRNYARRTITVEATVTARGVTAAQIKTALLNFLSPLAVHADGVTWRWTNGEKVPRSKIIATIDEVAPDLVDDVVLVAPATDVYLDGDELPWAEDADLTITVVEP